MSDTKEHLDLLIDALIASLRERILVPEDIRRAMNLAYEGGVIVGSMQMADKMANDVPVWRGTGDSV